MFDPKYYRNACARLTLGQEKLEEMIAMAENHEKKMIRRPVRLALLAAAMAAVLCITAAAAEIPAVKAFFATVFVTVKTDGDLALGFDLPSVAVEERDGRTILLVNEEETDITDALAREGGYLYEGDGFQVKVDETGAAVITAYGEDGVTVTYSIEDLESKEGVVYNVISDEEMDYSDYNIVVETEGADTQEEGDTDSISTYEVTTDENGAIQIATVK